MDERKGRLGRSLCRHFQGAPGLLGRVTKDGSLPIERASENLPTKAKSPEGSPVILRVPEAKAILMF